MTDNAHQTRVTRLALLSDEMIEFIRLWSSHGICEIGSGDGEWVIALRNAGISVVGYDTVPRHSVVRQGDHVMASLQHSDMTALIVWPPDGAAVQDWIRAWKGNTVILCGNQYRVTVGNALDEFTEAARFSGVVTGRKGSSFLTVYTRELRE